MFSPGMLRIVLGTIVLLLALPQPSALADLTLYSHRNEKGEIDRYVSLIGYFQVRYTHFNKDTVTQDQTFDTLDLHKARFGFKGKLHKYLLFKVEIDYSRYPDEGTRIYEAYARIPIIQYCELTGGVFKTPIRSNMLTSSANRLFADKPLIIHDTEHDFPEIDAGGMIGGNLFPISEIPLLADLPRGILRFYGAAQSGNLQRKENNEDIMFTARLETNPLGYRGYHEIDFWNTEKKPLLNIGLNYSLHDNSDFEEPDEFHRKRELYGIDAFAGYHGVCVSGGWFVYQNMRAGNQAYTPSMWQLQSLPSYQTTGYYVQVGGFLPVPWDKLSFLQNTFLLKFRYQYFTPQTNIGPPNPFAQIPDDVPISIDDPRRPTRMYSVGLDSFLFEDHLRLSLEYHWIDEVGYYLDRGETWEDVQIRNNELLVQMQLKF